MLLEGAPRRSPKARACRPPISERSRHDPLSAEGVHTYYGKSHTLHGVGLEVREGEIVALLGRNGAGKTTTLRSLVGLMTPREGKVRFFGQDMTGAPPYRIAEAGVGYVPEGRRVFANLTVEENLRVPLERPGPGRSRASTRLFRGSPSAGSTWAPSSPGASRRCCRSRARCSSIRSS